MSDEQSLRTTSEPTTDRQRIDSLDVLRGFALMGILVINIQSFSMPSSTYFHPYADDGLDGINSIIWLVGYLFFSMKFVTMFSMMFGAGIVLMDQHCDAAATPFLRLHFRRMILLLIFGLAHAYLIWYGDILMPYAICGFFVVWVRKWQPNRLLITGVVLVILSSSIYALLVLYFQISPEGAEWIREAFAMSVEETQLEIDAYRGSWSDHFPYRLQEALSIEIFMMPLVIFWQLSGLMCIGMALFKWKVLSAERSTTFYLRMALISGMIGLPLVAIGAYVQFIHDFDIVYILGYGSLTNHFGSLFVALMWIALVMILCRARRFFKVRTILSAYGRMAFTNYIGQSIIATWIFYGYGLGWFGSVSRVEQLGVVIVIWTLQLAISPVWLRYFHFGPLEWIWRTGAYLRFQPMRRKSTQTIP